MEYVGDHHHHHQQQQQQQQQPSDTTTSAATQGLTRKLSSADQLIAAGIEANKEGRTKEALLYFDQARHLQVSWLKGMEVNLKSEPVGIVCCMHACMISLK